MEISLSQLLQLKNRLQKEISAARQEYQQGAFVETTADIETNSVTLQEHVDSLNKILKLEGLYLSVSSLISSFNAQTKLDLEGLEMSIQTALEYAQLLRADAYAMEVLGNAKKTSVSSTGFGGKGEKVVTERLYDIKGTLKESKKMNLLADRISRSIERAGVMTTLNTEDHPKLEGVEEYL